MMRSELQEEVIRVMSKDFKKKPDIDFFWWVFSNLKREIDHEDLSSVVEELEEAGVIIRSKNMFCLDKDKL